MEDKESTSPSTESATPAPKKSMNDVISELEQNYTKAAKQYNDAVDQLNKAKESAYQASLEVNRALQILLLNKENVYNNIIRDLHDKLKAFDKK
jgi:hypothetical protein